MNWKKKIKIKHLFLNAEDATDDDAERIGLEISAELKKQLPEYPYADAFEISGDIDAVNGELESLYEWCDNHAVWVD